MATLAQADLLDERAVDVRFADGQVVVDLRDGRTIATPIVWYPRLRRASEAQRNNWRLNGSGYGIHWPELDEDLSVEGMLRGTPAPDWQQPD